MLSGIKRGKRKRSTAAASAASASASTSAPTPVDPSTISTGHGCPGDDDNGGGGDNQDDAKQQQPGVARPNDHVQHHGAPANNQTAAEALRRSLLSGVNPSFPPPSNNDNNSHNIHRHEEDSTLKRLERRGRILGPRDDLHAEAETTVVLPSLPLSDSRAASKSSHGRQIHRETVERDLSLSEMRRREAPSHPHDDVDENGMDEMHARNILRLGKSYKSHHDALSTLHHGSGADEDDATGEMAHLVHRLYRSHDDRLTRQQRMQKETSRQLARQRGMERYTRRSSWWVESPSFEKRYLIALGEKVSLVMIPSHETLTWKEGQGDDDDSHPSHANSNVHHSKEGNTRTKIPPTCPYPCRIVPLSHAPSISSLDEDAWDEVRRFRQSLRRMYRKYNMGVLFLETVPGNGNHGLQAKMEMVPVPREVERDAPLYFKHALAEAAQEWGVHGRSPIGVRDHDETGGNTISATSNIDTHPHTHTSKTLRNAVPKGFPYFYVGWEGGGYVQLIETDDHGGGDDDDAGLGGMGLGGGGGGRGNSKAFWRDFGMDTIAGMMGLDPVRFRRRSPARDGDKARILEFCDKWKEFDWTLELD